MAFTSVTLKEREMRLSVARGSFDLHQGKDRAIHTQTHIYSASSPVDRFPICDAGQPPARISFVSSVVDVCPGNGYASRVLETPITLRLGMADFGGRGSRPVLEVW